MDSGEKRLEYLNLEFGKTLKRGTIDHTEIICFSPDDACKHIFHTVTRGKESVSFNQLARQLNTISDISFTAIHNLQALRESDDRLHHHWLNLYRKLSEKVDSLGELANAQQKSLEACFRKISYLKQKLDPLEGIIDRIPSNRNLEALISRIDQEPKKIEQETVNLVQGLDQRILLLEEKIISYNSLLQKIDHRLIKMIG